MLQDVQSGEDEVSRLLRDLTSDSSGPVPVAAAPSAAAKPPLPRGVLGRAGAAMAVQALNKADSLGEIQQIITHALGPGEATKAADAGAVAEGGVPAGEAAADVVAARAAVTIADARTEGLRAEVVSLTGEKARLEERLAALEAAAAASGAARMAAGLAAEGAREVAAAGTAAKAALEARLVAMAEENAQLLAVKGQLEADVTKAAATQEQSAALLQRTQSAVEARMAAEKALTLAAAERDALRARANAAEAEAAALRARAQQGMEGSMDESALVAATANSARLQAAYDQLSANCDALTCELVAARAEIEALHVQRVAGAAAVKLAAAVGVGTSMPSAAVAFTGTPAGSASAAAGGLLSDDLVRGLLIWGARLVDSCAHIMCPLCM
jgi:hypothetical protein